MDIYKSIRQKLEHLMDESREALLREDDVYLSDCKDKKALEQHYEALNLAREDRAVIDSYVACIETMNSRVADLAYVAGVADAVKLLMLGLLD